MSLASKQPIIFILSTIAPNSIKNYRKKLFLLKVTISAIAFQNWFLSHVLLAFPAKYRCGKKQLIQVKNMFQL